MTMQDQENSVLVAPRRTPWNKGKLIGAKPPRRPKHVWSIRTKLQVQGRMRDLAMFNLATTSRFSAIEMIALTGCLAGSERDFRAVRRPGSRSVVVQLRSYS